MQHSNTVTIIGGGLAGSECALSLAQRGIPVRLFEKKKLDKNEVQKLDGYAELVCSNSFKSLKEDSAAGELKAELKLLGSSLLPLIYEAQVPAGGALAVDRKIFSQKVSEALIEHPLIELIDAEVKEVSREAYTIVACGPLVSETLAQDIQNLTGAEHMAFYDAAAPIVETETLNMDILFAESRYQKDGSADYLNAPMNKEEYERFYTELIAGERVILKDFEQKELFNACQPIEEVARTGHDSIRFGALKPVGLTDPRTGKRPWAVVQLRKENVEASAYNLVGFQTNLKFGEQKRIFRMIPGLEHAEFSRYGVMHRNTFINSPQVLSKSFALKEDPKIRFAGQITGTEGYTEAIASGLFAALNTYANIKGFDELCLPKTTVLGALFDYATDKDTKDYQPMHVNFGLMPALEFKIRNKKERYAAYVKRAQSDLEGLIESRTELFDV